MFILICGLVHSFLGLAETFDFRPASKDVNNNEYKIYSGKVNFLIALKLRNVYKMKRELAEVSNPKSEKYARYFSLDQIRTRFSPPASIREKVISYFLKKIKKSSVHYNLIGDMIEVTASISDIEEGLSTKLAFHVHSFDSSISIRAETKFLIDNQISEHISFVSLDSPIVSFSIRYDGEKMEMDPKLAIEV